MTDQVSDPTAVRHAIVDLTDALNVLGETDWPALIDTDDTPADCAERAMLLQGLAGMLQSVAMAAMQTVNDMVTGMVTTALADADTPEP